MNHDKIILSVTIFEWSCHDFKNVSKDRSVLNCLSRFRLLTVFAIIIRILSLFFQMNNIVPILASNAWEILRELREQCAYKWWGWSLARKKIASTWGVTVGFSTARILCLFNSHTNKYLVSVYWLIFRPMYLNQKKFEKV